MAKTLPSTGGASLIPGQGTKVLHVAKNLKKKKNCARAGDKQNMGLLGLRLVA